MKKIKNLGNYRLDPALHDAIATLYKTGEYLVRDLARIYNVTPKTVYNIARKHGVSRSRSDARKLVTPLIDYRRPARELRPAPRGISRKDRREALESHPYCLMCGARPDEGIRLNVCFIDKKQRGIEVLCNSCVLDKRDAKRATNEVKIMTRLEKITALKQTAPR